MAPSKSIKSALFRLLVLGILYDEDTYGYDIIDKIKTISDNTIIMKEGTLYPLLKLLKKEQLLRSNWRKSSKGKSRKYYSITEGGKASFKRQKKDWESMNEMINKLRK